MNTINNKSSYFLVALHLFDFKDSSRSKPIELTDRPYKCPLMLKNPPKNKKDKGFDCRIYTIEKTELPERGWGLFALRFLNKESARNYFIVGTEFYIWERGNIGTGIVVDNDYFLE